MEKKRSKGVTIFGILIIVGSLYQVLGLRFSDYRFLFQPLPEGVIMLRFSISAILLILGIITGIGLLGLKNIFRKIALFLGFYAIFTNLFEAPFFTFRHLPRYEFEA